MNYRSLIQLLYYRTLRNLPKELISIPTYYNNKKNIFLYFDYEREFSGHQTEINDDFIFEILEYLDHSKLKTTWFTVGKVIEKYPQTIQKLIYFGHEIGSHTYGHISTFKTKTKNLNEDYEKFSKICELNQLNVKGFHSPQNQWTFKSLKLAKLYNFEYDVVYFKNEKFLLPNRLKYLWKDSIIRVPTLCDDWFTYENNQLNAQQILNNFKVNIEKSKLNSIFGIGFHPWLMYNNKNLYVAFKLLIEYLKSSDSINMFFLNDYLNEYNNSFNNQKTSN